jgi:dephospho-CoA kinase
VLVAGLTGGIGSGKSTLAQMLADRGAEVIDADGLGRSALEPGQPAWHSVVDQFGDEILAPGGMEIDRKHLARIVFGDRDKLAALNAIVHPVIMGRIADTLEALSGTDEVVILDAALIVEIGLASHLDVMIVVTAPPERRKKWLTEERGMTLEDVEARMRSQMQTDVLLSRADLVVRNEGTLDDLESEADRVWKELDFRRAGTTH